MSFKKALRLFLIISLYLPSINYAKNADVVAWTSHTLLMTFTVDYKTINSQLKQSQTHYSSSAWSALHSFFGDKGPIIQNKQLSLHPKITTPAQIINSGIIGDVAYWQISEGFMIPELPMSFTAIVVVAQTKNSPFIIQSVNINRTQP